MSNSITRLFTTLLLTTAGNCVAASSVDLAVKGLITPSACEPSLSNGGVYELGKIPAKDLNLDQTTPLPAQRLNLVITCDASTLMAIEPRDNRSGSNQSEFLSNFGLGLNNNTEKLGYITLNLYAILANGVAARGLGRSSEGWAPTSVLSPVFMTSFTTDLSQLVPNR